MKKCRECNRFKSDHLFCKSSRFTDGLATQCKLCRNKYLMNYFNRPGIRERRNVRNRKRYQRPEVRAQHLAYYRRPEIRIKMREKMRKLRSTQEYKRRRQLYAQQPRVRRLNREWERARRERIRKSKYLTIRFEARCAVTELVRTKKLPRIKTQRCTHCNKRAAHYHHYKGYTGSNQTKVIPVCPTCHGRSHWKK